MKRKIKISIIEDDEFFAELLYWKLEQNKQYEVTVFNDPDTFLNTPAKSHDVAVIDYHLGNSHYNGLDIAKRIKNVPKIFISGQNDIVCALNMIKEGAAVDYINKASASLDKIVMSTDSIVKRMNAKHKLSCIEKERKKMLGRLSCMALISILVLIVSLLF